MIPKKGNINQIYFVIGFLLVIILPPTSSKRVWGIHVRCIVIKLRIALRKNHSFFGGSLGLPRPENGFWGMVQMTRHFSAQAGQQSPHWPGWRWRVWICSLGGPLAQKVDLSRKKWAVPGYKILWGNTLAHTLYLLNPDSWWGKVLPFRLVNWLLSYTLVSWGGYKCSVTYFPLK